MEDMTMETKTETLKNALPSSKDRYWVVREMLKDLIKQDVVSRFYADYSRLKHGERAINLKPYFYNGLPSETYDKIEMELAELADRVTVTRKETRYSHAGMKRYHFYIQTAVIG
jgi:hypothetical protein